MRWIILSAVVLFQITASAQNTTAENIIEGGKALVELVRVLKMPVYTGYQPNVVEKIDSCKLKSVSDLSFKNSTDKSIYISLFRRNGNAYETNVLTIKVLPKAQEYWYELKSGIYKYKIEMDGEEEEDRVIYREGEMKLAACENQVKEIK
ncbi:MAG: hypothetical protein WBP16_10190 [Ferruginibacter sp.]